MEPQVGHLAYRAGECARCASTLRENETTQEVALHIIGPGGTVSIHCWRQIVSARSRERVSGQPRDSRAPR